MPIEFIQAAAALFALLFVTGCATMHGTDASANDSFGEATKQTLAAQIIEPDPAYEYADPTTSGQHAAKAIERYRTDTVKIPERVSTSKATSSTGGTGL